MKEPGLILGSLDSQWLRLIPLRRTHPGCIDFWDGNWVDSTVDVSVGAFTGKYTACLRTDEFKSFRVGLDNLYQKLNGKTSFSSMEHWINIEVTGDGLGHFRAACTLRDAAGVGNTLKCDIQFDQTELAVMIKSLSRIEEDFPVIGQQLA